MAFGAEDRWQIDIIITSMSDRLNELHSERNTLKLQGRVREMIPLQLAIIAQTEETGRIVDLADAWNYLSALHHQVCEYGMAEQAARKALDVYAAEPVPSSEVLATFQFKLGQILAAQRGFSEAVRIAEAGLRNFSVSHSPPDEFLKAREDEVALMRDFLKHSTDAVE